MKGGALMLWDRKSIHTIHCFGDSLTAGYGALPCEGWVEVLAKRHPKMGFGGVFVPVLPGKRPTDVFLILFFVEHVRSLSGARSLLYFRIHSE